MKIIKRDGRNTEFDEQKIFDAVYAAAFACGYSEDSCSQTAKRVTDIVIELLENDSYSVEEIQDCVEKTLIAENRADIAKAYILYRQKRHEIREHNGSIMKMMRKMTFSDALSVDDKRANANIDADSTMGTMLQYGTGVAKEFNLTHLVSPQFAKLHREGAWHIHDLDFLALTLNCCQIDLKKLFKRGFSTGHGFLRTPNSIGSYAALTCIAIQSNQNDMFGGQSVPAFEYDLAAGVSKTMRNVYVEYAKLFDENMSEETEAMIREIFNLKIDTDGSVFDTDVFHSLSDLCPRHAGVWEKAIRRTERDTFQAMEAMVHNLNTMNSRAGAQCPFSSLNVGTGTTREQRMVTEKLLLAVEKGLGNGETSIFPIVVFRVLDGVNGQRGDPNYDLLELACRVASKRLFPTFMFLDSPLNKPFVNLDDYNTLPATMGCVGAESVVSYTFEGTLYVEGIGRMFQRVGERMEQKQQGRAEYYDTANEDLFIWDSHSNGWTRVKKVLRNKGVTDWKKVVYANGRILTCTTDHPLPIEGRGRTYVRDIIEGELAPIATYAPVINGVETLISPDEAWADGVVLCDGSITGTVATVSLGMDEREIADKLLQMFPNGRIKEQHRGEKGDYLDVNIGGVDLARMFANRFEGAKKIERHIPSYVFNSNREIRISFIAGMIDADGYINKKQNGRGIGLRVQLGSTNKELALQQMLLAQSVGLQAKVYENCYSGNEKVRYRVEFAPNSEIEKAMVCLKKKAAFTIPNAYPLCPSIATISPISKIEDTDGGYYSYDVETESDYFDVNGIVSHNCRTRVVANVNGESTTSGRGNLSFTSLNLPRIAIEANGNPEAFMDRLGWMVDNAIKQLLERFEIQAERHVYNFPILMQQGVWRDSEKLTMNDTIRDVIKHGTLSIGFVGLAEALVAIFGKHHGESKEAWDFGYNAIKTIREKLDAAVEKYKLNFSLIASPAESTAGRFAKIDRKDFGVVDKVTDREYYTNSFHVPVYHNCSMFEKIRLEAPFHMLCNGGSITYIEVGGDISYNAEAFMQIVQYMKKQGVGYGAINLPVDFDPVCGYRGIIGDCCPRCGRKEGDGKEDFQRLRRVTGYLSGDYRKRFNNAKQAEVGDRVKHRYDPASKMK